jgi:hypothetical protein
MRRCAQHGGLRGVGVLDNGEDGRKHEGAALGGPEKQQIRGGGDAALVAAQ